MRQEGHKFEDSLLYIGGPRVTHLICSACFQLWGHGLYSKKPNLFALPQEPNYDSYRAKIRKGTERPSWKGGQRDAVTASKSRTGGKISLNRESEQGTSTSTWSWSGAVCPTLAHHSLSSNFPIRCEKLREALPLCEARLPGPPGPPRPSPAQPTAIVGTKLLHPPSQA